MNKTSKMVRLAFLLAVSVLIHYIETIYLQLPMIAPGVKIGLANLVGLIVLALYGMKDYWMIGGLRVLLSALLTTGFGAGFMISIGGWLLASSVTFIVLRWTKCSIFGVSVLGAMAHSIGQIIVVSIVYNTFYMMYYLPILIGTAVAAGIVVALISVAMLSRLKNVWGL